MRHAREAERAVEHPGQGQVGGVAAVPVTFSRPSCRTNGGICTTVMRFSSCPVARDLRPLIVATAGHGGTYRGERLRQRRVSWT